MKSKKKGVQHEEADILGHEPVPGYKTVFRIAISLAAVYLFYIFAASL